MESRKESIHEAFIHGQSFMPACQYLPASPSVPLLGSGIGLARSAIGRPLHCSGIGMPMISGLGGRRALFSSGGYCGSRFASPGRNQLRGSFIPRSPMRSPQRSPYPVFNHPVCPPTQRIVNCNRPGMPMLRAPVSFMPSAPVQKAAEEISYTDVPFERKVVEYVPVEHTIQDSYTIENRTSYVPVPTLQPSINYVGVNSLVPHTTNVNAEQTLVHHPQSPLSLSRKFSQQNLAQHNISQPNLAQPNFEQFEQNNNTRFFSPSRGVKGTFSKDNLEQVEGVKKGGVYSPVNNLVSLRKNKFDSLN